MKRTPTLIVLLMMGTWLYSQNPCGTGRYVTELFTQTTLTEDIPFGSNLQPTIQDPNAVQQLFVDIYEPTGDTLSQRPLIIFAFAGGFVTGTRKDGDISTICERFAKRGYVTASIDYRLTPSIIFTQNQRDLYLAIIKAVHDMKSAIRFFRKDADSANLYRINPTQIFVGGISAGGVTSIHTSYLDDSEVPSFIAQDTAAIGGLEGLSGNPGYPTDVLACINLCGAIGDTSWMDNSPVPIISAHGTADQVVPYGSTDDFFGASLVVHGSGTIDQHAMDIGLTSKLLTWQGADHVPFAPGLPNADAFMDQTIAHVSQGLSEYVCVESSTSLSNELSGLLRIVPQPAQETVRIMLPESIYSGNSYSLTLIDISGKVVRREVFHSEETEIHRQELPSGMYIMILRDLRSGQRLSRRILFQ